MKSCTNHTRIHFYLWWNEFLWISKTWATTGVFVCHTVLPLRNAISGPNNFWPGLSHQLSKESHWWHSFLSCAWDLLHLDIQMCALTACEICWSVWHFCCHWLFVPMCFQSCGQVHSTNSLLLSCEISMGKFSCAQWISFNGWVKCALTLLKLNSGQWPCTCCQNRHHLTQAMLQMRIINCVYNIDVYWKYLWIFLTFFSCWSLQNISAIWSCWCWRWARHLSTCYVICICALITCLMCFTSLTLLICYSVFGFFLCWHTEDCFPLFPQQEHRPPVCTNVSSETISIFAIHPLVPSFIPTFWSN